MKPSTDMLAVLCACLACGLVGGCASPTFWPEFTQALYDAPTGTICQITIRDGEPTSYAAPVRLEDVPAVVRRTLDKIGAEGRNIYVAREWGASGPGYRWNRMVTVDNREEHRSWLLNDEGHVLERSYEIALDLVPAPVLAHAKAAGLGVDAVRRVSMVLGAPGEEGEYRMLLKAPDGRQTIVRSRADGSEHAYYRVIRAGVGTTR